MAEQPETLNPETKRSPLAGSARSILVVAITILSLVLLATVLFFRLRAGDWVFLSDGRIHFWLLKYRLAALLLAGAGAAACAFLLPDDQWGPARALLATAAIVLPLLALLVGVVQYENRWGWILALLPSALILQHVVYIYFYRQALAPAEGGADRDMTGDDPAFLPKFYESASRQNAQYFAPALLAIRYGVPAVLVGVVGVTVFYALFGPNLASFLVERPGLLLAARIGAAGAYTYVILYLGRRAIRHDITSGGATWCGVSLAIGPVLAATIQVLQINAAAAEAVPGQAQLSVLAVYYLAGLAPRQVANWLENLTRRLWLRGDQAAPQRTMPLTQLRGITAAIEERFAEEGITDLNAMAMADPLKLFRNTNFDKRLILSWIDEALLIVTLPQSFQALEAEGISGAIDLASYARPDAGDTGPAQLTALQRKELVALEELAAAAKMKPAILADTAMRLYQDQQLKLIWALYQGIGSAHDELGNSSAL